jgi:hypothetical protein
VPTAGSCPMRGIIDSIANPGPVGQVQILHGRWVIGSQRSANFNLEEHNRAQIC